MSYTFEELETWWKSQRYPVSYWTLVRTQEDGRTGYSSGQGNGYDPTKKTYVGTFPEQFSDRTRQLQYGPPATASGPYAQNFDLNAGVDPANFEFVKVTTGKYELRLTIPRWGAVLKIAMTKVAKNKLYTGLGPTIGNTTTQAMYVLSINSAEETPG